MMTRKQQGVTLVELMLAMAIGLIIMLGVGSVYSNSKKTYRVQEEFSRMQENGRFALNYIARYVRGAGYSGCASGLGNVTNTLNSSGSQDWDMATGLIGYEAANTGPNESVSLSASPTYTVSTSASGWTTAGNVTLNTKASNTNAYSIAAHSDVLVSRSADSNGVEVVDNNDAASMKISYTGTETGACADGTDRESGICDNDILMVSDCKKSRVFQANNVEGQPNQARVNVTHSNANATPGNAISSWGGNSDPEDEQFGPGAEIMKISTKVFYIGQGVNGPALFVRQGNNAGQEIIDGVESLQVLYGEDTDASPDNIPNTFVTADKVTDFNNVVAVKISILLASDTIPHRDAQAKSYILTGHSGSTGVSLYTPSDKRMRRVMSMVIKLRNRGFTL